MAEKQRESVQSALHVGMQKNSNSRRRPGSVSIRDVAARAGVSIATVSRAVNRIPSVDPELAKRVWKAIEEVGYLPNTQARALVSGRSHMLGLIVSEITNPFFPELIQEFENLAVAQGYEVLIGTTNYDPARTESLMRRLLQRNVDGVVVMTFGVEEELVKQLVEREFPLVFVDAGPELPNIRLVQVDYGEGIRQAVQHLAALGHRSIAFISATSVPGSGWRWMCARAASSMRRGSHTISVAPRFTARLIAAPNTGCDSVVFAPSTKMTSVSCSISRMDPDAALVAIARCIALTEDEWQRRVQWSTLFVPMPPRNIR